MAAIAVIGVMFALTGAATPAAAEDLVTNLAAANFPLSTDRQLATHDFAQSFTTGANITGYQLTSVSLVFAPGGSRKFEPVYVHLYQDNGSDRPGAHVAELTRNGVNYLGPVAGVNKYNVWRAECHAQPPHGGGCISRASSAHLNPNTTYWVYIWAGEAATLAGLSVAASTSESGATGWTLGNSVLAKPHGSTSSNYGLLAVPLKIKVEGTTNPEVLISISDATATEGTDPTMDFVVTLSQTTSGTVTVEYLTVDGTAESGSDFQAQNGTLTFQPGETSKTISVPIVDDTVNDNGETFMYRTRFLGHKFGLRGLA